TYWTQLLKSATPSHIPATKLDGVAEVERARGERPYPCFPSTAADLVERSGLPVLLKHFAREHRSSPYVVALASFMALVQRMTQAEDLCVATSTSMRDLPGASKLI